jgi:pimeloyl-ACP methyl ester carboxylesterase/membrane protein DedA with SNARE-associated domain
VPKRRPSRLALFALVYGVLLLASHIVRRLPHAQPQTPQPSIAVQEIDGTARLERAITIAYTERGPLAVPAGKLPILLLHGSPGSRRDFTTEIPTLAQERRVIVPDLPGFGGSTHDLADYSIAAHAGYVLELLDQLGIERVHVVGFSMGGGVAIELIDRAPDRVASITLLSSIGVQELELFGEARINHIVHGAQLGLLVALRDGFPHFGYLDRTFFGVPYARNFWDTDQRPLRGMLERIEAPTLILHGETDVLVPVAAAREHGRLIPQSQLEILPGNHFLCFLEGPQIAKTIASFVDRVEAGHAEHRADAPADRVAQAALPFDPDTIPPAQGVALLLTSAMIVGATFVSEDLACIGAGLLVAHGQIDLWPALVASFLGIFLGDLGLFLLGRWIGMSVLHRAPLRWFVHEGHVEIAEHWFDKRGTAMIFFSRFVPGMRLPTFLAAGVLRMGFARFVGWLFLASLLWAPVLVGLAALVGVRAMAWFDAFKKRALVAVVLVALGVFLLYKAILPLFSFGGRRRVWGRIRRIWNWEFWPPWLFYPPVVLYVLWLGIRHRSFLLFTAANPAIPAGGFIAESKAEILEGLGESAHIAKTKLISDSESIEERKDAVRRFMDENRLQLPIVLKPDAGQRGSGVVIARSAEQIHDYLKRTRCPVLAQEYVPGSEFGVFYYRYPNEERGKIFSITEKRMPYVHGDGKHTVEELILLDERAVTLAEMYLDLQAHQSTRVPSAGEPVQLVEIGTHCRGAIFLDGSWVRGPGLDTAIDELSRRYEGFFFGRYDIRAESAEALREGRGFQVIELNGVTSEATHIYDPKNGLLAAYRTLFEQWRLAFEIGKRNRGRGTKPATLRELVGLWGRYRHLRRVHVT